MGGLIPHGDGNPIAFDSDDVVVGGNCTIGGKGLPNDETE